MHELCNLQPHPQTHEILGNMRLAAVGQIALIRPSPAHFRPAARLRVAGESDRAGATKRLGDLHVRPEVLAPGVGVREPNSVASEVAHEGVEPAAADVAYRLAKRQLLD